MGPRIADATGRGQQTLRDAFAESCCRVFAFYPSKAIWLTMVM